MRGRTPDKRILITYPETLLLRKYSWFPHECRLSINHSEEAYLVKDCHVEEYMMDCEYSVESEIFGFPDGLKT